MQNTSSLHSIGAAQRSQAPRVKSSNLSQLVPHTYTTTRARVIVIKSKEKQDELGKRSYIFGICEDQNSRAPFICYKPYPDFFHDGVFEFEDVYVHQFEDNSLLLVITERSSIHYLINEDPKRYVWNACIGDILRPMGTCRITLEGVLTQISSSSGLVKRCETCGRVAFEDRCPNGHDSKLFWAVRISGKLSDRSGSINVVFPQQLACKLIGRTIGEILQFAEGQTPLRVEFAESYVLQIPDPIELCVAYTDTSDAFRSTHSPIIVDLNESRIIYPNNFTPQEAFANKTKKLDLSNLEDRRDLARLAERLLEIKIRKLTQLPKVNGILLTQEPIDLYSTENAKLYVGFRTKTIVTPTNELVFRVLPSAEVYETVQDYVHFRRRRGASSTSIKNSILNYRRNVILAPNGELAAIVDLKFMKAGDFKVPFYNLTLPEFWNKVHDIHVTAEETPLAVTKLHRLKLELTFPPSCVFFDKQSIRITHGIRNFMDRKRHNVRFRSREIVDEALKHFSIGTLTLTPSSKVMKELDTHEIIMSDIRERLLGKIVKATGSVIQAEKQLYFIPRTVDQAL